MKSLGKEKAQGTLAYEGYLQIQNIYHTDNALLKLPPSERRKKRKKLVKPLVKEFFKWVEKSQYAAISSGKTKDGIKYCLNQEKYLCAFLEDPAVPLDNNVALSEQNTYPHLYTEALENTAFQIKRCG